MAYVGDVTPYDRLQPILARYLTGQILGQLFGQAAGGILGDYLGWRNVFFVLAGMFALASAGLAFELAVNPLTRQTRPRGAAKRGFIADYTVVLSNPFARIVIAAAFIEGALAWGALAYVGAKLRLTFGLSYSMIGLIVACFGIGGLIYAGMVKVFVRHLGQIRLAIGGALILMAAYVIIGTSPVWWLAPVAMTMVGLGFYMLHNTLQTNATQMTPEARGTAVALFSSALYVGQTVGVAFGALVLDRLGATPLFLGAALGLPLLAIWFASELKQHRRV